jgi:hypothetical protein
MDGSFAIKPRPGLPKAYAPRDPVPVREAVETDLDAAKAVAAAGDGGGGGGGSQREPRHDHVPHDVVADPQSREVILRENDVRTHANEPIHPDQALQLRAYRAQRSDDGPPDGEPHANIKA